MKKCAIADCPNDINHGGHGWCRKHYMRWYLRGGDPSTYVESFHGAPVDELSLRQRLEVKQLVLPNGCWQWTGHVVIPRAGGAPRGDIIIKGKHVKVHRLAWTFARGEIPKGLWVLHKCDNSLCINPDHLYLGTHKENMDDVVKRRRSPHLKLTEDQVRMVRSSPLSAYALAKQLGLNKSSILAARRGLTHRHIR